jgi:hypothetical protein
MKSASRRMRPEEIKKRSSINGLDFRGLISLNKSTFKR